jgi:hypothetical protein
MYPASSEQRNETTPLTSSGRPTLETETSGTTFQHQRFKLKERETERGGIERGWGDGGGATKRQTDREGGRTKLRTIQPSFKVQKELKLF